MESYKILVGRSHGVKPGNIVGAIANEVELDSKYIGHIEIFDEYSTVDLPEDMPPEIMNLLKKVFVSGQRLNISKVTRNRSGIMKNSGSREKGRKFKTASKGKKKRK